MMTEREWAMFLAKLNDLMVGWRVVKVEKGEGSETVCSFTVIRGSTQKKFDLGATDLGCWVGPIKTISCGRDLYDNFESLISDLRTYLDGFDPENDENPLIPVEDVKRRYLGFKCKKSGLEWWATFVAIKNSSWSKVMSTPDSRLKVMNLLFRDPSPSPEKIT